MIAVRRPYDLGDRIVMSSADSLVNPGPSESWFVEGASRRRVDGVYVVY